MDLPQQLKRVPGRPRTLVALTSFLAPGLAVAERNGWSQPPWPSAVMLAVDGSARPALLRATHRDQFALQPAVSLPATPPIHVQGIARGLGFGPLKQQQPRESLAKLP